MADLNRALEDIAWFSNRFAGILEVGDKIKELTTLINQQGSMEKMVSELTIVADDLKAKTSSARKSLKEVTEKLENANTEYLSSSKQAVSETKNLQGLKEQYQAGLADMKRRIEDERQSLLKAIKAEAEQEKKTLFAGIKLEEDRLFELRKEIARIKESLA